MPSNPSNITAFLNTVNPARAAESDTQTAATVENLAKAILSLLQLSALDRVDIANRLHADRRTIDEALDYLLRTRMVTQTGNRFTLTKFAAEALSVFQLK